MRRVMRYVLALPLLMTNYVKVTVSDSTENNVAQ